MRGTHNRRKTRVRDSPGIREAEADKRTRWRDDIRIFTGAGWSAPTSDREWRRKLKKSFV